MNDGTRVPRDVRGHDLVVGQLVCYATNDRYGGLNFGRVFKINTKHTPKTDRDTGQPYDHYSHTIVMEKTDVTGAPVWDWTYDNGQRVELDKQLRSGRVEHHEGKFMIL